MYINKNYKVDLGILIDSKGSHNLTYDVEEDKILAKEVFYGGPKREIDINTLEQEGHAVKAITDIKNGNYLVRLRITNKESELHVYERFMASLPEMDKLCELLQLGEMHNDCIVNVQVIRI